ncbi:MAG: hypothetical protein P8Y44_11430 [Acidobacteriota bacterium]
MEDSEGRSVIDFNKALLDPAAHFDSPQTLLASEELDRDQKIELLRRWYRDALALQVAAGEGMAGGERNRCRETLEALQALGATVE